MKGFCKRQINIGRIHWSVEWVIWNQNLKARRILPELPKSYLNLKKYNISLLYMLSQKNQAYEPWKLWNWQVLERVRKLYVFRMNYSAIKRKTSIWYPHWVGYNCNKIPWKKPARPLIEWSGSIIAISKGTIGSWRNANGKTTAQ